MKILEYITSFINKIIGKNTVKNDHKKDEKQFNDLLTESELEKLKTLKPDSEEYRRIKAKAIHIYKETGKVPDGFLIDSKGTLRRSTKGKTFGKKGYRKCDICNQNIPLISLEAHRALCRSANDKPAIGISEGVYQKNV